MNLIYSYQDDQGYSVTIDLREVSSTLAQIIEGFPIMTITFKNSSAICALEGDRVKEFREMYGKYIDYVNEGSEK